MKDEITTFYNELERVNRYTKENKERAEKIEKLYNKVKEHFGNKVLDIGCGGGLLGFIIEKDVEKYTGIDIQAKMIETAKQHAEETGSKCRFIEGDAAEVDLEEKYDTVVIIGNSLGHITPLKLQKLLENIRENVEPGAKFIIDYRDLVNMLYTGEWKKDKKIQEHEEKGIYSQDKEIDTEKGEVIKVAKDQDENEKFTFTQKIWSPFITKALMKANNWKLIHNERTEEWNGWIEVYEKK